MERYGKRNDNNNSNVRLFWSNGHVNISYIALKKTMSLTSLQHERCVEIMNELLSFHTSRMFSQPVEPIRDNCPNYFKVIKNPMDLGTIMNKLNENKYKSVAEWKADVNLVWSNSFIFNPKTSLMRSITKELSDYFHKITVNFTGSEIADWNDELQSLLQEMNVVMKEMSKIVTSSVKPNNILNNKLIKNKNKNNKKKQNVKNDYKYELVSSDISSKVEEELPIKQTSFETVEEKKEVYSPLTIEQLRKLTNDINSLKDEYQLNIIGELLKENEKTIDDDDDMIEVDIKMIHPYTQYLLQKQIEKFKLV